MRVALTLVALLAAGCGDPPGATRAVEALGMTDVKILGAGGFGCGQDDWYITRFQAVNPRGKVVTGVVCGGMWKNNTVRFD